MSEQGMTRLEADVRAMVLGAGGDPGPIKTVFAANLRATPFALFSARDELARLGAEDRHRIPADVEWARGLVNEVLQALGMGSDGRWRNLMLVARGIVDLITGEIQSYRRQHGGSTGSMTTRVLVVTLGILALATSASAEGTWIAWERTTLADVPAVGSQWRPKASFESNSKCRAFAVGLARAHAEEVRREHGYDPEMVGDSAFQFRSPGVDEHLMTFVYECWPDSFDPRGPKGK